LSNLDILRIRADATTVRAGDARVRDRLVFECADCRDAENAGASVAPRIADGPDELRACC